MQTLVGRNRVKLDGEVISTLGGCNEVSVDLPQVILSTEGLELAKALPGKAQGHHRLVLEVGDVEENSIKVGELDVNGIGLLIRAAVSFEKKKRKNQFFYSLEIRTIFKIIIILIMIIAKEGMVLDRKDPDKKKTERERKIEEWRRKIIKVDFFSKKTKNAE